MDDQLQVGTLIPFTGDKRKSTSTPNGSDVAARKKQTLYSLNHVLREHNYARFQVDDEITQEPAKTQQIAAVTPLAVKNTTSINIANVDTSKVKVVYFDLETAGLALDDNILQLAAKSGKDKFTVYITPTKAIHPKASQVNKLTMVNGTLHYRGKPVQSVPLREALDQFLGFLLKRGGGQSVLVAHNNAVFDCPRLLNAINRAEAVTRFKPVVRGFTDSLPLLKSLTGDRSGQGRNTLGGIAKYLGIRWRGAHNAMADVNVLERIFAKLGVVDATIVEKAVPWEQAFTNYLISRSRWL